MADLREMAEVDAQRSAKLYKEREARHRAKFDRSIMGMVAPDS
jgi:hypothetical protein